MSVKTMGLAYAVFLIVGAFFGWKAGSRVSLIMGLASAAVILLGVYLSGTNLMLGTQVLFGVSALLTMTFLMRFIKTQKIMPSGMLLLVSALVCIYFVSRMLNKK